jgi:hypothetical protein
MPKGFGRNSWLGWAQETTWATAVAASKFAECVADDVRAIRRREPRPTYRSRNANREDMMYDAFWAGQGGGTALLNYVGLLRIFEHAFGDSSGVTTTPEGGRFVHTFTLKDTQMDGKGLTFYSHSDVDAGSAPLRRIKGFKINRLIWSFSPERDAQLQIEGGGQDLEKIATVTPTFPSRTTYVAGHQTLIEVDDVARKVDRVEITMDNGLDLEKRVLGDRNPDEPIPGDEKRVVSGVIECDALEADLTKFLAGTLFKLEVLSTGPTLVTGNYRHDITLLKCLVTDHPFLVRGPGVVKSSIPFVAEEPNSGELFTLAMHNNESSIA